MPPRSHTKTTTRSHRTAVAVLCLAAMLLLVLLVRHTDEQPSDADGTTLPPTRVSEAQKPALPPVPTDAGGPLTIGTWRVEIRNTTCGASSVGAAALPGMQMRSDRGFCLVNIDLTNKGRKQARLDPTKQILAAADASTYVANKDATRYASPDTTPFDLDAYPGEKQPVTLVFDVPDHVEPASLVLSTGSGRALTGVMVDLTQVVRA